MDLESVGWLATWAFVDSEGWLVLGSMPFRYGLSCMCFQIGLNSQLSALNFRLPQTTIHSTAIVRLNREKFEIIQYKILKYLVKG